MVVVTWSYRPTSYRASRDAMHSAVMRLHMSSVCLSVRPYL